jgi:hypothetical protein
MNRFKDYPVRYTTIIGGTFGGALALSGISGLGLVGSIVAGGLLGLLLGAIIDQ